MNIVFFRRCNTLLNGSPRPAERATAEEHVQTAMFGIRNNTNSLLESNLVLIPIHTGIEATADNPNPAPGHWSLAVSIKKELLSIESILSFFNVIFRSLTIEITQLDITTRS